MIDHPDRTSAAATVAQSLAAALRSRLQQPGRVGLVLSGGSTPRQTIELLSQQTLDWQRVAITLTDERCVPKDHADSNTRMVLELTANTKADAAQLVDLASAEFDEFPRPAASLIGMGTDGHFASLFPDAANLADALNLAAPARSIRVTTAASPFERISQTLAALIDTDQLLLLAFGSDKQALLKDPGELPIAALLQQTRTPIDIHWAP